MRLIKLVFRYRRKNLFERLIICDMPSEKDKFCMMKTARGANPWMHTYICTYLQSMMILLRSCKLLEGGKYCMI